MKNSNRYKDIFSSKEQLSHSDIEKYRNQDSSVSDNSIEQKEMSDQLEQDALEGWEQLSYNTSILKKIKSKLFNQSSFSWMTALSSILIGVALVLGYQAIINDTNEAVTEIIAKQKSPLILEELNIESSEMIIPSEIEKMQGTAAEEQIVPKVIIQDFLEKEEFKIEFPALEPIKISTPTSSLLTPIIDKIDAKEIYLNDLKLIDYRIYRDKPVIETKQLILTGTSADKENENSESFDTEWKNVEIAYIQYLEKSIYYFKKGKSKKALARFETIIKSYPQDVNANFYAGICLYNFGEYKQAIEKFEICLSAEYRNFDDEAIWMKALSLEHQKKTSEAKKIFLLISESEGFYANQAKEKLN